MADRPDIRADLRDADYHATWREVYDQMEVGAVGHE
jgi:hypothetical protein